MAKKNIVVGQSGGPTAVINSSLAGVIAAAEIWDMTKFTACITESRDFLNEDLVDISEYVKDKTTSKCSREHLPRFWDPAVSNCRRSRATKRLTTRFLKSWKKNDIECLFYIGGNDSMDTIKMLSDYAELKGKKQRFMGVPKTIDNDLPITDHTPGYGSAAKYIASSLKEVIRDNSSFGIEKPTVVVVEIMGRHAGWLTAAAALSRGEGL